MLAAFFGVMVSFGSLLVFTFSVFLKPLSSNSGGAARAFSAAFGIAAMSVAVCSPFLGRLLDRFGPRPVILPCMVVFGVAFGSLALLTANIMHFYAVFLILGVVGNGTTQMGYSRAVSSWFTERRGMALAFVVAGVGVGSMILPALAQLLIDRSGWRTAYATLGLLILVMGVPLTALFVREQHVAVDRRARIQSGVTVRTGLKSRAFWLLVAMLFLSSIAVNGAISHMSAILTDRGLSASDADLALSVLGAMSLLGRLITGALLDRFSGPNDFVRPAGGRGCGYCFALGQLCCPGGSPGRCTGRFRARRGGGYHTVSAYALFRAARILHVVWLHLDGVRNRRPVGPVMMGRVFDLTGSYSRLLALLAGQTSLRQYCRFCCPVTRDRYLPSELLVVRSFGHDGWIASDRSRIWQRPRPCRALRRRRAFLSRTGWVYSAIQEITMERFHG